MSSPVAPLVDPLVDATCERRAARYAEIIAWHDAVERGDWRGQGQRSPSAWIAAHTGETVGASKRLLFLGERLTVMPHIAGLFRLGLVAESGVLLAAEAWHTDLAAAFQRDELLLADWIHHRTYPEAKAQIDAWVARQRPDAVADAEQASFEARNLSVTKIAPHAMGHVSGQLDHEGTAIVRAALSLLSQPVEGDTRLPGQRRADALVDMARFTLAHHERPVGSRRRPPKVDVVLAYEHLVAGQGISLLDDQPITPERARRLACDAGIHRNITVGGSATLDYGRQTRTVPEPLWQNLVTRDRGCRFPGCQVRAEMCDAHHSIHWAEGGETSIDLLVLLCWFHHHVLHEQRWRLEPLGAGHFELSNHRGQYQRFSPPRLDVVTRPDQLQLV